MHARKRRGSLSSSLSTWLCQGGLIERSRKFNGKESENVSSFSSSEVRTHPHILVAWLTLAISFSPLRMAFLLLFSPDESGWRRKNNCRHGNSLLCAFSKAQLQVEESSLGDIDRRWSRVQVISNESLWACSGAKWERREKVYAWLIVAGRRALNKFCVNLSFGFIGMKKIPAMLIEGFQSAWSLMIVRFILEIFISNRIGILTFNFFKNIFSSGIIKVY